LLLQLDLRSVSSQLPGLQVDFKRAEVDRVRLIFPYPSHVPRSPMFELFENEGFVPA